MSSLAGVPILVMTIATFMILNQLKIAPAIVTITYAALLGAIALGSALAFGLGGREVAARMLEGAYTNVQQNKDQWKRDLDQGMTRAKAEAERVSPNGSTERIADANQPKRRRAIQHHQLTSSRPSQVTALTGAARATSAPPHKTRGARCNSTSSS